MAIQQLSINKTPKRDRFSDSFGAAMDVLGQYQQNQQQEQMLRGEDEALRRELGIDLAGVRSPRIREQAAQLAGQRESQQLKNQSLLGEEDERYNTVKKYFGEKAANLYKSAPEGGKTELLKAMVDSAQRGMNFEDLLGPQFENESQGKE